MTEEMLNRANALKKIIDKLEAESCKLSYFYSKKELLTKEEFEELIHIAMVNTSCSINRFKEELKKL